MIYYVKILPQLWQPHNIILSQEMIAYPFFVTLRLDRRVQVEKFATLVDLNHRVKPDGNKKGADASPNPDGDDIRGGRIAQPRWWQYKGRNASSR